MMVERWHLMGFSRVLARETSRQPLKPRPDNPVTNELPTLLRALSRGQLGIPRYINLYRCHFNTLKPVTRRSGVECRQQIGVHIRSNTDWRCTSSKKDGVSLVSISASVSWLMRWGECEWFMTDRLDTTQVLACINRAFLTINHRRWACRAHQ